MRIAVNTRFLLTSKMEGFGWYTYEVVSRMVRSHPEHTFIFFFDRAFDPSFVFAGNVIPVVLAPQARHPILFRIWFNVSVRRALKKYKADLFFSPDGYLSLTTNVPQIAVIHDINFEHNPEDVPQSALNYLKYYFPKFTRKADHILTVSEYSRQDIITTYGIPESSVSVAWNGASEKFRPADADQKKAAEERFAGGHPYLLFVGALHPRKNVGRLLEAYDQMKQNQPDTPFKLVIVGEQMFSNGASTVHIPENIGQDVLFTGHLSMDDLVSAMSGASIFTYVPYFEGFGIPLVEAMRCGIPILSGNRTSLPEVAGDAALYCDPFDVGDICAKLTELCGNPSLRDQLGKRALERAGLFSWNHSSDLAWEVILSVAKKHQLL